MEKVYGERRDVSPPVVQRTTGGLTSHRSPGQLTATSFTSKMRVLFGGMLLVPLAP